MFYFKPTTIRSAIIISLMSGLILFVIVSFGVLKLYNLQENIEDFYSADYQHCNGVGFPITFEFCKESLLKNAITGFYRIIADILIWSAFASTIFIRPLLFINKSSGELSLPEAPAPSAGLSIKSFINKFKTFSRNIYVYSIILLILAVFIIQEGGFAALCFICGSTLPQAAWFLQRKKTSLLSTVTWMALLIGTIGLSMVMVFSGFNLISLWMFALGIMQIVVAASARSALHAGVGFIFIITAFFVLPVKDSAYVIFSVITASYVLLGFLRPPQTPKMVVNSNP